MDPLIADIERAIERMTGCLRPKAPQGGQAPGGPLWQVLAVGPPLDPADFAAREEARSSLRLAVEALGVRLVEHVWIWDATGRAQLVLAAFPEQERAERLARAMRGKGLAIRVVREAPTPDAKS
jgi:hypothetical protein